MSKVTDPELLKQLNAPQAADPPEDRDPGTFLSRSAGLAQGAILDPMEELGRFIEHATNTKIAPDALRDKLKSFRGSVRSTQQGRTAEGVGEVAGSLLPFVGTGGKAARIPGLVSGAIRGGLSAGLQPTEGGNDYMPDKAMQALGGALTGGMMASPLARHVASWLATRGLIHGGAAAIAPHQWWTHYPLHHLAQSVYRHIPPSIGRVVGDPGVVGGTTAGLGALVGRDITAPPPAAPRAAPPPPASRPATSGGSHIHYGGWTTKDQEDDE
jgi:hypothetical protein